MATNKKPADLSDTDRAELEELLSERAFEEKLRARRKARFESVKLWAQWATAVGLLISMAKEPLAWALSRLKGFFL